MNQGRQSVCPSLPLPDSKPRELCRFNDGADQRQVRRDSQREADPGLSSDQEQRREAGLVRSRPLADLGAFVTRTASSPPVPTTRVTASAAYVRPLVLL